MKMLKKKMAFLVAVCALMTMLVLPVCKAHTATMAQLSSSIVYLPCTGGDPDPW